MGNVARASRWAWGALSQGLLIAALASPRVCLAGLAQHECDLLVEKADAARERIGDFRASVYTEYSAKEQPTVVRELLVYSKEAGSKMILLFSKPRAEQGKGYLLVDRNLWFYDPSLGRWERRTDRDRVGGSSVNRSDFDAPHFTKLYDASCEQPEKVGVTEAYRITLRAKPTVEVAFPILRMWLEKGTYNELKREQYPLSGKLMRTDFYSKWKKIFSDAKGGDILYPTEMRYFDELIPGASTLAVVKSVDLSPITPNTFTKAWLEGKSR